MAVEPLRYETVRLHEPIGPFAYTIPANFNAQRLPALSIEDPGYLEDHEGRPCAEPSVLCGQHTWVVRQRYAWGGSVHAKCDVRLVKPVYPGQTIRVGAEVVGTYERRGGRYVVFQVETRDEGGALACRVQNTMLLNLRELLAHRAQATGAPRAAEPAAEVSSPGPQLALSFGPKTLRREDLLRFFRAEEAVYGPHPSIHNDEAIAREAGLADVVAPGRYLIALATCMFARIYGPAWFSTARYSVSFLNNLLPGIVAETRAIVSGPPGRFSVSCRDAASGTALLAGTVSREEER
jgi:acyl dehydratase